MITFFDPLLNMNPLLLIILVSLFLSFLVTIITKYTTNQKEMKQLKDELKQHQADMKTSRNDTKKMMETNKKSMEANMKYMMHSFKSMIFTFIPVIIIFAWLNANLAFAPINPGDDFKTTMTFANGVTGNVNLTAPAGVNLSSNRTQEIKNNMAEWEMKGIAGKYVLYFEFNGRSFTKDLTISDKKYSTPVQPVKDSEVKQIKINNSELRFFNFNFLGYRGGWLGTYIILSMIFTSVLRKWMKVY